LKVFCVAQKQTLRNSISPAEIEKHLQQVCGAPAWPVTVLEKHSLQATSTLKSFTQDSVSEDETLTSDRTFQIATHH